MPELGLSPVDIVIDAPAGPVFKLAPPGVPDLLVLPASGPPGPPGPIGGAVNGQPRFSGEGPPPVFIPDARPLDIYIDTLTGDLYQLT